LHLRYLQTHLIIILFTSTPSSFSLAHITALNNLAFIRSVKWGHSNVWSHYDLCVVGQHGVLCEVNR